MTRGNGRARMQGLTIIELLVVMGIIAILAAIVMVSYSGTQRRGYDAAVQMDLVNNMKLLSEYYSDNGAYPAQDQLGGMPRKLSFSTNSYDKSGNAVVFCRQSDGMAAGLIGKSKSGTVMAVTSTNKTPRVVTFAFPTDPVTACPGVSISDPGGANGGITLYISGIGWRSTVDWY